MNDIHLRRRRGHAQPEALPRWPTRTIAMLAPMDESPNAKPEAFPGAAVVKRWTRIRSGA